MARQPTKKRKDLQTDKSVLDPATGQPVQGGVGQTGDLASALSAPAPGSPVEAAGLGATPDAAKMAGAKVAPSSALRSAPVAPSSALRSAPAAPASPTQAGAQPTSGTSEAQTAAQQAISASRPQVGATPSVEERVAAATVSPAVQPRGGASSDLAAALRYAPPAGPSKEAQVAGAAAQRAAEASAGLSGLDALLQRRFDSRFDAKPGQSTGVGGASDSATAGPAHADGTPFTAADFYSGPNSAGEVLAAAAKSALQSAADVRLTKEDLAELGFNSPDKLQALQETLGRNPIGSTGAEVREALEAAGRRADALRGSFEAQATDSRLGSNARSAATVEAAGAASQTAGGLSRLGETRRSLEGVDSIRFGGEERDPKELIESGEAEGFVSDYLAADSKKKAELAKREPDLAEWIDANAGAIDSRIAGEKKMAQAKADQANQEKAWADGAAALGDPSLAKSAKLFPVVAQLLDQGALAKAGVDAKAVGASLAQLKATSPSLYQEAIGGQLGDVAALVKLGLGARPDDHDSQAAWSQLVRHGKELEAVHALAMAAGSNSPNAQQDAVSLLFPGGATVADVEALVRQEKLAGIKSGPATLAMAALDSDRDGAIEKGEFVNVSALATAIARAGLAPIGGDLKAQMDAAKKKVEGEGGPGAALAKALGDGKLDDANGGWEFRAVGEALAGGGDFLHAPKVPAQAMLQALDRFGIRDQALRSPWISVAVNSALQQESIATIQKSLGLDPADAQGLGWVFSGDAKAYANNATARVRTGSESLPQAQARLSAIRDQFRALEATAKDPYLASRLNAAVATLDQATQLVGRPV